MKFSLAYLSTLVAATTAASIPRGCSDITKSLGDKPESLFQYFQQQVCGANKCTATLTDHTEFLENTIFPELFKEISQRLDVPAAQQTQFKEISGEVKTAVQKSCANQGGNSKICDDKAGVVQFGKCALKAAEPVLSKQGDDKRPSEEQCLKLKDVFTDDQLWSKTFHGFVDEFADQCKNGGGEDEK